MLHLPIDLNNNNLEKCWEECQMRCSNTPVQKFTSICSWCLASPTYIKRSAAEMKQKKKKLERLLVVGYSIANHPLLLQNTI